MKTEKRIARVGEKILIVDAKFPQGDYENGNIFTVLEVDESSGDVDTVEQFPGWNDYGHPTDEGSLLIFKKEYEVVVDEDGE